MAVAPCYGSDCRDGELKLKRLEKGYVLSCNKYPACKVSWWLPKFIKTATVDDTDTCANCKSVRSLTILKLKLECILALSPPGTPPALSACPVCDPLWQSANIASLPARFTNQITLNSAQNFPSSRMPAPIIRASWHAKPDEKYSEPDTNNDWSTSTPQFSNGGGDYSAAAIGGDSFKNQKKTWQSNREQKYDRKEKVGNSRSVPVDPNAPLCGCGELSVVRTVSKEGPNKGREFRSCHKPM